MIGLTHYLAVSAALFVMLAASLVIFGILRNLPTLYLFIPVYFSPYQNAILVILRWTAFFSEKLSLHT